MKTKKPIGIYVHIPFCVRKCLYCDFLSSSQSPEMINRYVRCLLLEIRTEAPKYTDFVVKTIFVGGGTPSLLRGEQLSQIISTIRDCYQVDAEAEMTIEMNPGTVDEEKLSAYQACGVNRLSIGVQSLQEEELQALGRIHSVADFYRTYELAVKTGFHNINVDLMSAIPKQTVDSYRDTLLRLMQLQVPPTHISAYSLIVEEGTPFYEHTPELPDEETDRLLYKITDDILSEYGYHRYEISNYARNGYACRHNTAYWQRRDYAGFGIGAASLVNETRFSNTRDLEQYLDFYEQLFEESLIDVHACKTDEMPKTHTYRHIQEDGMRVDVHRLTKKEQMEEFMFLGLRLTDGVSRALFCRNFEKTIDEIYPGIVEKHLKQGLLQTSADGDRLMLTERGLDVSNVVMADFLIDELEG